MLSKCLICIYQCNQNGPSNELATYFSLFTLYALTYFSSLPNFPSSSHKIQTDKVNLIHIPLLKTLGIGSKGVGSSKGDTVADAADFTSDVSILLGWISSLAPSEMATVLATFGRPLDGDFSNLAVASLESDLSCRQLVPELEDLSSHEFDSFNFIRMMLWFSFDFCSSIISNAAMKLLNFFPFNNAL